MGHDLKSLGGGARTACSPLATEDDLDLHHDTMVGAYLLDPARRTYDLIDIAAQRGLAAAARRRRSDKADDGQLELGGGGRPPDPAAEARLVFEIAKLQREGMNEHELEKLMDEVEMPLVEVLAEMERSASSSTPSGWPTSARASSSGSTSSRPTSTSWPAASSRSARRSSSRRSSSTSSA